MLAVGHVEGSKVVGRNTSRDRSTTFIAEKLFSKPFLNTRQRAICRGTRVPSSWPDKLKNKT